MSFVLKDRVLEASTFTGLGNVSLSGPLDGYDDFASEIGNGNSTWVMIEAVDASGDATGEWEAVECSMSGGELVRGTVFDSSNNGSPVDFAAGSKKVWCNVPAQKLAQLNGAPGTGTVTAVSVVTANGFAGSVADPTTTPAITISISNPATVRTTLGLGTAALNNTGDFDAAGTAAAAMVVHLAAVDPHPQYLTPAEGDAVYQPLDTDLTALAAFTITANTFPARSSAGVVTAKPITDFAFAILDDLDAATVLGTIGAQPLDATLTALANLTIAANTLTIGTGVDAFTQTAFAANTFPARSSAGNLAAKAITDFGLSLVDDADAATARATLGVSTPTSADASITPTGSDVIVNANWHSNFGLINGYVTATVASNNVTFAIKNSAGSDPSSSNPVKVVFRNVTPATGDFTVITLTAATSFTVTNGSSLGTAAAAIRVWVVGFNDGGTFRLGAVNCVLLVGGSGLPLSLRALRDNTLDSSVAEGGAGGAGSAKTIYTGTAVTSKAMRILAYCDWSSGLGVTGVWDVPPTKIQQFGPGVPLPGDRIQFVRSLDGAGASGTTTTPADNTIPQDTEGNQFLTVTITPQSPANVFRIGVVANLAINTANSIIGAIHRTGIGDANALMATIVTPNGANFFSQMVMDLMIFATFSSAATYSFRAGDTAAGTTYLNRNTASAALFNGTNYSQMFAEEIMA